MISELLLTFGKGHLGEFFNTYLPDFYNEEEVYLEMLVSFLPSILAKNDAREEMTPFIQDKIEEITNNFDSFPTNIIKAGGCAFLVELWTEAEEFINEDASAAILNMLKYLARCEDRAVQYATISHMFKLLEIFTLNKNPAAPVIYKALIFVCVENHYDDTTRQFMMSNFTSFFETSEAIPVGILLEPLIKQFMESEGTTYNYNTFDFEFFTNVAKHPKLKLNDAIPLMDALAKIYLNDTAFCFAASVPLMLIISRFKQYPLLMGYTKKFITLALSTLIKDDNPMPESQKTRKRKHIPLPPSRARKSANKGKRDPNSKELEDKLHKVAVIEI
jgi:hypothetical protein